MHIYYVGGSLLVPVMSDHEYMGIFLSFFNSYPHIWATDSADVF